MSTVIAIVAAVIVVALVIYWDLKSREEIERDRQQRIRDLEKRSTLDYLLDPWEKDIS
jgi:hypothetical protein